jgi:hypothetical protein
MCNLYSKTITANGMIRIPAREMQQAIHEGFNPYKHLVLILKGFIRDMGI